MLQNVSITKTIISSILLFLTSIGNAQILPYLRAITLNANVYKTTIELKVTKFSELDGTAVANETLTIKPETGKSIRYKIIATDGDFTIIRILPRVQQKTTKAADGTFLIEKVDNTPSSNDASKYLYHFKTKDLIPLQKVILSEKIVGTPLIFPFKYRSQDRGEGETISTEFTLGYTFGLRLKLSKKPYKQTFLTIIPYGFGLSNAKYFYKKEDGTYSAKTDAAAVTYWTSGLMFTSNKVNYGVFVGVDGMIDNMDDWAYQGQTWVSFGLGFKFKAD